MLVLLVERAATSGSLALALRQAGCDVLLANSGNDALSLAQEQSPDLIVLENRIAGMSAWETAKHIGATTETAQIPVLTITPTVKRGLRQTLSALASKQETPTVRQLIAIVAQFKAKQEQRYRHEPPPRPELPPIPAPRRDDVSATPRPSIPAKTPAATAERKLSESVPHRHQVHRTYDRSSLAGQLLRLTDPSVHGGRTRPTVGTSPG